MRRVGDFPQKFDILRANELTTPSPVTTTPTISSSDPSAAFRSLSSLLDRLVEGHRRKYADLPVQAVDADWLSPCQVGNVDGDGSIRWQPVRRSRPADFSGLEQAMELELHPDIKSFYGSFWSDSFQARTAEGGLTLIQAWNEADFDRLLSNVIGHLVEQRRNRVAPTVFIACTDEDELILSVDNVSGQVVLAEAGDKPTREVAATLAEFLDRLEPVVD